MSSTKPFPDPEKAATSVTHRWRGMRRWGVAAAVAALLFGGVWGAGAMALDRFLEGRDFRSLVARKIAKQLGGRCGFLPFYWNGLSVYSDGLLVKSPAPRSLRELRAVNLSGRCNLVELWHGQWRIDQLTADEVQAAFGEPAAAPLQLSAQPELEPPATSETPLEVDLRKVVIAHTGVSWGDPKKKAGGAFRNVATTWLVHGKNLEIHGSGGTFQQSQWPEAKVGSFKLYYEKPRLRVDEGSLMLGGKSLIGINGHFDFGPEPEMDLQLRFQRCPIAPFLNANSRGKFSAHFDANAHLQKDLGARTPAKASGRIVFSDAEVRNIDGLEKTAAFTDHREFARPTLEQLSANFRWAAPELVVENLVLEARGLVRIEGEFTVRDQQITGTVKLGTTAAVLEKFPGAREQVFTEARGDYFWTSVKLSGSLQAPKDDLKPRLVAAAQSHFAKKFLAPLLKPGAEIIEQIEALY